MPILNNALAGAAGSGGADADFKISHSLRFNKTDSAYLNQNFSAGNRRTWTWSGWVKLVDTSGGQSFLFGAAGGFQIYFANNKIYLDGDASTSSNNYWTLVTAAIFRDPSAWYHLVFVHDTTQTDANDRFKIYVNGVQVTEFGTNNRTNFTENYQGHVNNNVEHRIGRQPGTSAYANFLLAENHFVDGEALAPDGVFGRFDNTTGVWNPIRYTGNYGTNGYYLDFSNTSNNDSLGYDAAGSNNWSVTNLVTSVSSVTPPKCYEADALYTNVADIVANGTLIGTNGVGGASVNNKFCYIVHNDFGVIGSTVFSAGWDASFAAHRYEPATNTWTNTGGYGTSASEWNTWIYEDDGTESSYELDKNHGTGFTFAAARDGQSNPARYTGTYPTLDTSNFNTLGSANAGSDVSLDSPTNYESDSGNNGGNYCVWNPLSSNGGVTISNGNLDTVNTGNVYDNPRATFGMSSGKWYWEATITSFAGGFHVGIATPESQNTNSNWLGNGTGEWAYMDNGQVYGEGTGSNYGSSFTSVGKVIGVAFDADAGTLTFYNDGVSQGVAFTGLTNGPYLPAMYARVNSTGASWNFGQRPYHYPPGETGGPAATFKSLCTENLTDPSFDDPSDAFDVNLYDGNSGTQQRTDLSFSPDLLWIKSTTNPSVGSYHHLIDSVRGKTDGFFYTIYSNRDEAENTYPGSDRGGVTSLNSDGFTLAAGSSYNFLNETNHEYVRWAWDAGEVTNPVGDLWQHTATKYLGIKFASASGGTVSFGQTSGSTTVEVWTSSDNSNWTQNGGTLTLSDGHTLVTSDQYVYIRNTADATFTDWYVAATNGADGHFSSATYPSGSSWSGPTYTDYDFRRDGGVVNTDGTIPTVVRASPSKGFSIVQWENPSHNVTIGHGLNKAPTAIWTKGLGTYEWMNYHKNLGNGYRYPFNTSTNKTGTSVWQSSDPTSSVFNFADNTEAQWVAYCFTPTEGVFASGSYEGGSSPFVYCGFRPALVMLKNIDINGEEMVMYDVARDKFNIAYQTLYTNSASGNYDGSSNRNIDILSNGFRANTGNPVNQGGTHIWMAWADQPFKYARAR